MDMDMVNAIMRLALIQLAAFVMPVGRAWIGAACCPGGS